MFIGVSYGLPSPRLQGPIRQAWIEIGSGMLPPAPTSSPTDVKLSPSQALRTRTMCLVEKMVRIENETFEYDTHTASILDRFVYIVCLFAGYYFLFI